MNNNNWQTVGSFAYKMQDYSNSCFSACLQTALANLGSIESVGRVVEDDFNNYFSQISGKTLDQGAPGINEIQDYVLQSTFCNSDNRIKEIKFVRKTTADNIEDTLNTIKSNFSVAVIGALDNAGGHATSIIKYDSLVYHFDPRDENNTSRIELDSIAQILDTSGNPAINLGGLSYVEVCWIIIFK